MPTGNSGFPLVAQINAALSSLRSLVPFLVFTSCVLITVFRQIRAIFFKNHTHAQAVYLIKSCVAGRNSQKFSVFVCWQSRQIDLIDIQKYSVFTTNNIAGSSFQPLLKE